MTPERQRKIDKINNIAFTVFMIALILIVAITLIPKIWEINTELFAFKICFKSILTINVVSFIVDIVSGIWATDEEKKRIKEALQEIKDEEASEQALNALIVNNVTINKEKHYHEGSVHVDNSTNISLNPRN